MSNETSQPPASAFDSANPQENKTAAQINPASAEAQELRETGMRPITVKGKVGSEEKAFEGAPEKSNADKGTTTLENPQAATPEEKPEKKSSNQVGSGDEIAGLTQLAAERASAAATHAKEAAVIAAATAAAATKETARKYGAAAVIDAERMYGVGKQRVAGWVQGSQNAVKGAAQSVTAKTGEALKKVGDTLVAAGTKPQSPPEEEKEAAQINTASEKPQELSGPGLIRPIDAYKERESDFPEKLSAGSEKPQTAREGAAEKKNTDAEKILQTPEKSADTAPTEVAPKQIWS
ncbi:hypothetical protein NADE_005248 [Nannochloris sp. 'desiccata']|nr:hypothetical protein NADE_005248 [Chlorella desiccata (nom. nud.)]